MVAAAAVRSGPRSRRVLAAATALASGCAAVALASPPVAAAVGGSAVTAVAVLSGAAPVTVPGVRLRLALPALHQEVVAGSAAALDRLAGTAGVRGLADSTPGRVAGAGWDATDAWAPESAGQAAPCVPTSTTAVGVAVVDTGVSDTTVLNRACGRLVDGTDTSWLLPGAAPGPEFTDGYGHGTYVASLIAGQGVGVDPAARIVDVKVADAHGQTSLAAVLAGLEWVADNAGTDNIRVVNLSLSVDRPGDSYGADPLTTAVDTLVQQGLTVVAAAGNTAATVSDPGFDPLALTAGAADTTQSPPVVAPFSGYGVVDGFVKPDLVAPGTHLLGVVGDDSWVARSHPGDTTALDGGGQLIPGSGTSGAAAVTSGAVALLAAKHPELSPADAKSLLTSTAGPVTGAGAGAGLIDVPAALKATPPTDAGLPSLPDAWWATGGPTAWSTRTWSTRTWSTRTWSTRTWSTRTWSTRTWSTRTWSVLAWGNGG